LRAEGIGPFENFVDEVDSKLYVFLDGVLRNELGVLDFFIVQECLSKNDVPLTPPFLYGQAHPTCSKISL
jgi:hypothetical protein